MTTSSSAQFEAVAVASFPPSPPPEPAVIEADVHAASAPQCSGQEAQNNDEHGRTRETTTNAEIPAATATAEPTVVDQEPELRAVVVEQPGYHLYRTPSTYAYSSENLPNGMSFEQYTLQGPVDTTPTAASTAYASAIGTVTAVDEEEKEEIVSNEYHNRHAAHSNNHGWVASATHCAIPVSASEEPQQQALAGMPTYAVGATSAAAEPATVLNSASGSSSPSHAAAASSPSSWMEYEDSELTALKRAAAYGGGNRHQKPEPRATEDLDLFYARTCEFWNALAMDTHANSGDIDIERIMEESMRLAREQYHSVVPTTPPPSETTTEQATVVEITEEYVHPSELLDSNAVRAEFVGQHQEGGEGVTEQRNYENQHTGHTATAVAATAASSSSPPAATAQATQVHDGFFEQTAEATVLDSAPVDKLEGQIAWQNTEVAQVLQPNNHEAAVAAASASVGEEHDLDRKPAAINYSDPSEDQQHQRPSGEDGCVDLGDGGNNDDVDDVAVADQEGEVVQIVEEIHPSEYGENDAEAELVGTEFTATATATATAQTFEAFPTATEAATATAVEAAVFPETENTTEAVATTATVPFLSPEPAPPAAATEVVASPVPETSGFESNERSCSEEAQAVAVVETTGNETSGAEAIPVAASVMDSSTVDAPRSATKVASDEGYDYDQLASSPQRAGFEETSDIAPSQAAEAPQREPSSDERVSEGTRIDGPTEGDGEVPDWLRPSPERQVLEEQDRHASTTSSNTSQRSQLQYVSERASQMTSHIARSSGNIMEHLFGDTRAPTGGRGRGRANTNDVAQSIVPRNLLPWSVIHSTSNDTWVATLQTNQKALDSKNVREASKSLRAFSLPTETQAVCLAKSWTPPRMLPFSDNPTCHICKTKFAVFRRPCHCRNCGVCVCKDCAVQWPNKMIPETYNVKKESMINACKACEWLCNTFRLALLDGNMDQAVAVHATGNVNLTSPFANVKGEEFFPVHAAVMGGNLKLLKWLVDDNCCPIKSVRVSGKTKELSGRYTPIVTSKGRSLLGIAMENESVEIVRYLVVRKGISIASEKDITPGLLIKNLDKVLRLMPDTTDSNQGRSAPEQVPFFMEEDYEAPPPVVPSAPVFPNTPNPRSLTEEARDFGAIDMRSDGEDEEEARGTNKDNVHGDDECIICFDRLIDCVATPCGHQMCCLECSNNISRCPVCAQDCSFLRVFKP